MRRVVVMTAILCSILSLTAAGVCVADPWYFHTLDTAAPDGYAYPCLALDGSGHPHISYYDSANNDLKYAAWNGSGWDIDTVDSAGDVGKETSLALDASGYPHISYLDDTNHDLKYASWNGSTWSIQTVDATGYVGYYPSLALDSSGYPHVSYFDWSNWRLKYAAWNGASWTIRTVSTSGDLLWSSSLALDTGDYPHISYQYNGWFGQPYSGFLKYAVWNGSSWDTYTPTTGGYHMYISDGICLVLDADDHPHISLFDPDGYRIFYMAFDGIGWNGWRAPSTLRAPGGRFMALEDADYPHLGFRSLNSARGHYDLKYAAWNGTNWDTQIVDGVGDVAFYTPLALDADGYPHMSYYEQINGELKYATPRPPPQASHDLPATGYSMISLPLTPSSATVHDVLCDDLGHGNYYMWRWDGGRYYTVPTTTPGCQATTLSAQEGYWVLAPGAPLDIDVGGSLPHPNQRIPLQTGWNIVPAPYEATMDSLLVDNAGDVRSLADAQAAGWVAATFFGSHDGTGSYSTLTINQAPPDKLSFWHGYWMAAAVGCWLIVPQPSGGAAATAIRAAEPTPVPPTWAFDIHAASGSSVDSITIAAADGASDAFDGFALDKPKPPAAPGEGRLRMVLVPDAAAVGRGYPSPPAFATSSSMTAGGLATEAKSTAQQTTDYHFILSGGVKGEPVTLSWPHLSRLSRDRVAILTDRDTGKRTFMRSRARYEFAAPGADGSRHLGVTVKPAQQARTLITSFSAVPLRGGRGAELTFSLAADASVDISLLNVAGRLVGRVRQGVSADAGTHAVTWSGRSLSDTPLPNGLYLCVLRAKAPDGRQASAVRRVMLAR